MSRRANGQVAIAALSGVDPSTIRLDEVVDGLGLLSAATASGERVLLAMPVLKANASPRLHRLWWARVEANLTGCCPVCGQVAGTTRGGRTEMHHDQSCPVISGALESAVQEPQ